MTLLLWIALLLLSIVGLHYQRKAQTADSPTSRMVVSVVLLVVAVGSAKQIYDSWKRHSHRPVSISDPNQIPMNPSGFATDDKSAWFGAEPSAGVFRLFRFTPSLGTPEGQKAIPLDPPFSSVPRDIEWWGQDRVMFIAKAQGSESDTIWVCEKDVIKPYDLAPEGSLLGVAGLLDAPFLVMESTVDSVKVVKLHRLGGGKWKEVGVLAGHPGGQTFAATGTEKAVFSIRTSHGTTMVWQVPLDEGNVESVILDGPVDGHRRTSLPPQEPNTLTIHREFLFQGKWCAIATDGNALGLYVDDGSWQRVAKVGDNLGTPKLIEPTATFVSLVTGEKLFWTVALDGELPHSGEPKTSGSPMNPKLLGVVGGEILFVGAHSNGSQQPFHWWYD